MLNKPNILFILIDDLGWRDLSCYGSNFYETPRLDQLAREGMRFTHAYASCPVCSPTRASVLSGKYPARVGVTQYIGGKAEGKLKDVPYLHFLPLSEKSIASVLKDEGYQTWHVGKWHLGDDEFYPTEHGFDVNIGGCHRGFPPSYFSPYQNPQLSDGPDGECLTDRLTDEAIRLIRKRGNAPFFLNLWHYAVHTPIQAPSTLVAKYRAKAKRLKLDQVAPFVEGEVFPCYHKKDKKVLRRMIQSDPTYAAMIENLDSNIGRVLDTLKQEGLENDTLVVFSSDNGGLSTAEGSPTCNLPLSEGKGWNYEGGTRVCQIAKWPGRIQAQSLCHDPVTSTDFYPTFLKAAGLPLMTDQHVDGVDLSPVLYDNSSLERDAIFWHYPHYSNQGGTPAAAVVMKDWKLIEFFEDDSLELYHLGNDISETQNLSGQYPKIVARLHAKLKSWQKDIEARFPEVNEEYLSQYKAPKVANNAHE